MAQDITPSNNQGVTSTNTMNPRTISAQSAGSVSPTIITQNQNRRMRRAAEREERRRQNLAANVERAEVEREYQRLREEERKANAEAEARRERARREAVVLYAGGVNTPLQVTRTNMAEYLGGNLRGAQEAAKTPGGLSQYQTIGSDNGGNIESAYRGLDELAKHVSGLIERGQAEERMMQNVRGLQAAQMTGGSATTSVMSDEARAAHERLIQDKTTTPEMRSQLKADLDANLQNMQKYQASGGQLSQDSLRYLSESVYRGGSNYTREQKQAAGEMLAAAGSQYDVKDFNRAADSVLAAQLGKQYETYSNRYQDVGGSLSGLDSQTKERVKESKQLSGKLIDTYRTSDAAAVALGDRGLRDNTGNRYIEQDPGKAGTIRANAAAEARNLAEVREAAKTANIRDDSVNSILRIDDGNKINLSKGAFFGEQLKTEKIFGSDWTSAGGEAALDALAKGKSSSTYSEFKGLDDNAGLEYILVDNSGKQRYTLRTGVNGGGFAVYGWTGDIVASGQTSAGLKDVLKELNVPFNEKGFNPSRPELSGAPVTLAEETDISGISTAAAFKSAVLGTFRGNEEIERTEANRVEAINAANAAADLKILDNRLISESGYTLRINGDSVAAPMSPGIYLKEEVAGAEGPKTINRSDITIVDDPEVTAFAKTVGEVAAAAVPIATFSKLWGATDSKRIRGSDSEEGPDFVVSNESPVSEFGDFLIGASETVKGGIDELNKMTEDATGNKLISLGGDSERSLAEGLVGLVSPTGKLAFMGESAANAILGKGNDISHVEEVRRSAVRQTVELPAFAGSLIKMGDSVAASYDKGGADAAKAAAAYWGGQAATGLLSAAVKNPKELVVDLEAGLAVGGVTSAATKPFKIAAARGVVGVEKLGEGAGVINTKVWSVPMGPNGEKILSVLPRSMTSVRAFMDEPLEGGHVQAIKIDPITGTATGQGVRFYLPKGGTPDTLAGQALPMQWISVGTAEGAKTGARDTLKLSTGLFSRGGRIPFVDGNTIIVYKNIPKIGDFLTKGENEAWISKLTGDAVFSDEEILGLYNRAREEATKHNTLVAIPTPKSLRRTEYPENELILVPPKPKTGAKLNPANNSYYYEFELPNKKFVGFDSTFTPIYEVDLAKGAAKGVKRNPLFFVENLRETAKDLKRDKTFNLYYESRALQDKAILDDKLKIADTDSEPGFFQKVAYEKYDKKYAENLRDTLYDLRRDSKNPEVKAIENEFIDEGAKFSQGIVVDSDSNKLLNPSSKRVAQLIRAGYYDKRLAAKGFKTKKQRDAFARAIEQSSNEKSILNTIVNRPTARDKFLTTGKGLQVTRFGLKPNPKKLYLEDVLNEPWSAETAQLFPNKPQTGDIKKYLEGGRGAVRSEKTGGNKKAAKGVKKSEGADILYDFMEQKPSRSYAAGAFAGLSIPAIPKGKIKDRSIVPKEPEYTWDYSRRERRSDRGYGDRYKADRAASKYYPGYKRSDTKYRLTDSDSTYKEKPKKEKGYRAAKGYKSEYKPFEFKPYAAPYTIENPKYTMGKYLTVPYKGETKTITKYNPTTKELNSLLPKQSNERVRRVKKSEKKDQFRELGYSKFKMENVEVPIVRAEDVLFGENIGALELPANTRTFFEFGNKITTKKPKIKKAKKRHTNK